MYREIIFFFNNTATTEIYTLSLHDALPISGGAAGRLAGTARAKVRISDSVPGGRDAGAPLRVSRQECRDRKSTRLNSSHANISYAVFCLKKKKNLPHSPCGDLDPQRIAETS